MWMRWVVACIYDFYFFFFIFFLFFFFKQKTAYEIGTGDWSSDVCSSDLVLFLHRFQKIWKQKIFYHPAVWHVFLAQKWPALINSL